MKGYNVNIVKNYLMYNTTVIFLQTKDPKEIAKLIANEPKQKYNNPRIPSVYKAGRVVVITQSENPVVLAQTGVSEVKEFKVPQLSEKGQQLRNANFKLQTDPKSDRADGH